MSDAIPWQVLMEVYSRLNKVDEFLPLAKQERYMFTFRGAIFTPEPDLERHALNTQRQLHNATYLQEKYSPAQIESKRLVRTQLIQ